jgi:hypothetical protein
MAYPGDPSGPAAKGPGAFASARLTPEDFEHLAAAFRPSWELDEAPFTGNGAMSPADLQALQGVGGTHADVRAAVAASAPPPAPATHAVPKATVTSEPEDSVIIDRSVADIAAAARTPLGAPVVPVQPPAAAPWAAPAQPSADRLAQTRIVSHVVASTSADITGPMSAASFGRSKKPLWLGLGAGIAALVGIAIWVGAGGSSDGAPMPPATPATLAKTEAPAHDLPAPEATAAPAAPRPTAPSALGQTLTPVATSVPAAAPQPTQRVPVVTPASQQAPRSAAVTPAPKPAARPKPAAGTIVHDVPF